ncbi:sensor histidine kinase [Lysobacter capsici]|jgi:two-component system sensor histidine kinase DesK|uniref:Two-component system sensor kinase n=1 Tax=Lysobacter capsici AZ78 TaxID=1444315 RepID=A0A108U780_9GAMM|nr:sensor histidine kinase [Lysobacter capsici]ALN85007.1 histidine kinase-, DNA gyrase B-, and HSP90-like ATPase family protein [Lysobacter capsici]ATE71243.1 sensor histidine kinase [Lysobacter capsici]KWS03851.1 Putative two-component system sensor kinase [Lysobacter capsici AZ78]UOF16536.1 sensor histidine kinase [Lysobacter capsici]WND82224.1 sensor histidine kinase [Lysobacter capsici]
MRLHTPPIDTQDNLLGWHLASLLYLSFVFIPLFFWQPPWWIIAMAIASVVAFLPIYWAFYRGGSKLRLWLVLAVAGIGYGVLPYGIGGGTYLIFAAGMIASFLPRWHGLALAVALFAIFSVEALWILPPEFSPVSSVLIQTLVGAIVYAGVLAARSRELRNAELRLTQEEVRRLASLAERERIGRDLHDLLGHTLSVVVLKSQLAARLLEHDKKAAQDQICEVERVAREALTQVREAVAGIRANGLQAELAAARLALLGGEISLDHKLAPVDIPLNVEAALALALRESVTNVLRHARARRVDVELTQDARGGIVLRIADDGRGGVSGEGHGLTGMRERLHSVGGVVEIESPHGAGTRLSLLVSREALAAARRLPAPAATPGTAREPVLLERGTA